MLGHVYFWNVSDEPSSASLLLFVWSRVKDDKDLDNDTHNTFLFLISPLTLLYNSSSMLLFSHRRKR